MSNVTLLTKAQLQKRGWIFTKSSAGLIYATDGSKKYTARSFETLRKKITQEAKVNPIKV